MAAKIGIKYWKPLDVNIAGNKKASDELTFRGFYKWRRGSDSNRRFYGFANRSFGPLRHLSLKNVFKNIQYYQVDVNQTLLSQRVELRNSLHYFLLIKPSILNLPGPVKNKTKKVIIYISESSFF